MKRNLLYSAAFLLAQIPSFGMAQDLLVQDFGGPVQLNVVGRGSVVAQGGVLKTRDAWAMFGDNSYKNYTASFRARVPKDAEQVQIWASLRAGNRYDRYILGMKGGLQDDLYLTRINYLGTDELMGVRPLGFHPVPGEWYEFRVEVCEGRIRVFLGDEKEPRLDVDDPNGSLCATGGIGLGGSWIDNEFDDLKITPLAADALKDVPRKEKQFKMTAQQKEQKRQRERAGYEGITVAKLDGARTEVSLDGGWLFMPTYDLNDKEKAISASENDDQWHVMPVPSFWNPSRIWLHGETMGTPNGPESKGVSDTYFQMESDRCENQTFDYHKTRAAWYRQWVTLPEEVKGKDITLTFDAVAKSAEIYVNGHLVGTHLGMYGEVRVDASEYFHPGKNLVVVKVTGRSEGAADNNAALDFFYSSVRESEQEDGKVEIKKNLLDEVPHGFYAESPAGIWQPVKLTITDVVRASDVYIKPSLTGADIELTVKNTSEKKRKFAIETEIVDKATGETLYNGISLDKLQLAAGADSTYKYNIAGLKPKYWEPQTPNLYDFKFKVVEAKKNGRAYDVLTETSGFRTFEVKDGQFFLNGRQYWLRGGNQTAFALGTNDVKLADKFMGLMKDAHVEVTRTHTTPFNKLWMDAADRNGIGISFEGTWPWLFLHSTPIPDRNLIKLWADEWYEMLKKYRNHPSLLFWTVNNEMKFYDNDNDLERAKEKFRIISDVVQQMRQIDPTRPMCFDSNYQAKGKNEKYGKDFMDSIDDGDIDDMHAYYNWYDFSLFRFFNGEFQQTYKMADRPLISQEMSTGYLNNETGHPVRSYQLIHQNPVSLVGYDCYDYATPESFKKVQAFTTGELAEALRRSCDKSSGIMHFGLITWFKQVYDAQKIKPWPTYYALKRAMQPVLVSAELWGRHAYAGTRLATRICVVNDLDNGKDLSASELTWKLVDEKGRELATGKEQVPAVKYYTREWITPTINIPAQLPSDRVNAKLLLSLKNNGQEVSANEYELLLANKEFVGSVSQNSQQSQKSQSSQKSQKSSTLALLDGDGMKAQFDSLGIATKQASTVKALLALKPRVAILSGIKELTDSEMQQLRTYQQKGGRLLILNSKELSKALFPEHITGWIDPTEGDITFMERDEADVFDGLEHLDLRYFNNNKREMPRACTATFQVNRGEQLTELVGQMKIHAYMDGKIEQRLERIKSMRGFPLLEIADGKGRAMVSGMCTEKAITDPVAAKLLVNMVRSISK